MSNPSHTNKLRSYCDQSEILSDLSDLDDDKMAVDDEGTSLHEQTDPEARREGVGKSISIDTR